MPLSGSAVSPPMSTAQGTVLEQEEFRLSHSQDGINEPLEAASARGTIRRRDKSNSAASLIAYAQLATYRFSCSQSFVVRFERGQANIIAEASPSLLLEGEGGVGVDEGHREVKVLSLRLAEPCVVDTPNVTANSTQCVIRDLTQDNPSDNQEIQFFAAVPIHDANKDTTGAVCVVDKTPHLNFGDREVASMQEIADLVACNIKDRSAEEHHLQAERLINGLTAFVSGQVVPDLEQSYHFKRRPSYLPGIDDLSLSEKCSVGSPQYTHPQTPGTPPNQFFSRIHGRRNSVTVIEGSTVSHSMSLLFSRASALLQKCMELDGVLFLDATRSNARRLVSPDTARHQSNVSSSCSPSMSDLEVLSKDGDSCINSPGLSSAGPWRERVCEPLGWASSGSANRCTSQYSIPEGLLHDLFAAYPKGTILNTSTLVGCTSQKCGHGTDAKGSRHHAIILRLVQDLPEARSLLFLPMWNWNTSRWLAGALLWTCDSQRPFEQSDLFYVKAYGDAIVSEAAQMDWQATEKSKSDLLSSVSHELRSPLHGMLASVELLHTTDLQPAQQDMLTMIETCGLTLMDTLNYLLDFTKINNLTSADAKNDGDTETSLADLACEFDLDTLVEDVADTLYAGHRSLINASQVAGRYLPSGSTVGIRSAKGTESATESNDLSVIVRVEPGNWKVRSIPGGWRRIVMNLLGNAFKFTKSGFIEVTLARKIERTGGTKRVYAYLTITDTGCGISPEYLEHKLFHPFAQENILTEGVGLGLSIVDRLVTNAGGQIDVKSTVGTGTQFEVYIPVEFVDTLEEGASEQEQPQSVSASRVSLVGLNVFSSMKTSSRRLSVDTKRRLSVRSALSNAILSQPGWTVSFADTLSQAKGDIGIVEESSLAEMADLEQITTNLKALIILGQYGSSLSVDPVTKELDVVYVPQPLTPRKIIGALHTLSSLPEASKQIGSADSTPHRQRSLSEAFALAKQTESPPVVEESVDEFRASTPKASTTIDRHVLIVDDNDINIKILATFMRRIGCSYETANNGLVALEKYQQAQRQFNYVLMVMDGIISTSKIREYEEENSLPRAAIMAVTGVASATMQQQAFAAGIDDYLVKPLSLRDLKRVMNIA
ncbi:putative sensor histidine kinase/response regulator [Aspergillus fischeri NRRL 181]|uniref:Sensor histidine kinase/response regulator, putative n=1 Tax=Neosartorya fischeri (strain ATCC 1020 / DSM 3700 / CBS 544.65 / FGSC A1164 / JCM 1740 / NRRL 181 / WB 181) TaxID=331117 RepID=A1CV52_NEOFI|nr:sensor histidine kinase/response regulator, putative [Aspergillus fischeri NRRL 181]EAW25629.1 sensor histidine kinase/response regulator, putative [Aspergillus fischeri NRRL 181]